MSNNSYILEWYGPFSSPDDVIDWEERKIGFGKTYLYFFKGRKKYAKIKDSIYCGQAFKQSAGKRLKNKDHHIYEVIANKEALSIWVAKFSGKRPSKYDVNLVEKVLTSTMDQALVKMADDLDVINETNKLRPRDIAYIISEWYKPDGTPVLRYTSTSICSLIPDVLACYPNDDYKCSTVWGCDRLKRIFDLK